MSGPDHRPDPRTTAPESHMVRAGRLRIFDLIGLEATDKSDPIAVDDFCAAIRTRISDGYPGISEFEDAVGWRVEEFLQDPDRLYDMANWDCLRDVASSVGIDPVAVLPHDNQPSEQVVTPDA